ncbi:PREDICTED: uncharacterized protein LOC104817856 [Tarenaya hassleriana]|uniref:uncharacterized protein LOC104817856 n=1 Tax=Tarenaya hassleriana TaxID=28532 RepID=UPI00053C3085|nr:PREDICTED: uncharacterized protein LOC104817856 [Tarenaya hassleriana]
MGNCIRHESPMHWGGDDWDSLLEDGYFEEEISSKIHHDKSEVVREIIVYHQEARDGISKSMVGISSEVKIKIEKKQLEELLGKVNVKELNVQQVLTYLMNSGDDRYETNQRSWRPVLQSIPEI